MRSRSHTTGSNGLSKRPGVDLARQPRVAVQVGRPLPALDPHRQQLAVLDQLVDGAGCRPALGLQPVVVGQAAHRRHPVGRAPRAGPARGRPPRRRRRARQDLGREHPLGQVVDQLELAVAAGDREVADQEEVVERLAWSPTSSSPSGPSRAARRRRGRARSRPRASATSASSRSARSSSTSSHHLPSLRAVGLHPVLHHRPQLDRHERLDVRPVLHHPARLLLRGPRQQVGVVGTHPREQRHVVRPLQHVDRVDLEHAGAREGARERAHRRRRVTRVAEPLGGQRDAAGLRPGQLERHRARCRHERRAVAIAD